MKCLNLVFGFSILFFSIACGGSGDNPNDDSIAFLDYSSGELLQMDLNEGETSPFLPDTEGLTLGKSKSLQEPWKDQKKILNAVCGSKRDYSLDDDIFVFSPDGANLGFLDDSWEPAWGPYGRKAAFACGINENGNVVVVSNSEHSGVSDDWSRSGSAFLSDRMEIIVTDRYGSSALMLTNNDNGDWLPRWYPFNRFYALNNTKFAELGAVFREAIVFESNRNGESQIILMSTKSPNVVDVELPKWDISANFPKAQSPSWSELGSAIAFNTGEENDFEIFLAFDADGSSIHSTNQNGFPLIWEE